MHNPWLNLVVGIVLILSAFWEIGDTISEDLTSGNFRAAHGILVFGVVTALKALADMFAGLELLDIEEQ